MAHRNIHCFISLHVIGVETDEYIPLWEFYGLHTEISTARWPSSVNTDLGDTQSVKHTNPMFNLFIQGKVHTYLVSLYINVYSNTCLSETLFNN